MSLAGEARDIRLQGSPLLRVAVSDGISLLCEFGLICKLRLFTPSQWGGGVLDSWASRNSVILRKRVGR
jgi:hypothetical protein